MERQDNFAPAESPDIDVNSIENIPPMNSTPMGNFTGAPMMNNMNGYNPAQNMPNQMPPKPKKKKGPIIAGILTGVLVLGGCGGFVAAYAIANNPTNVALSAVSNFFNAKDVKISGNLTYVAKSSSNDISVKLSITDAADGDGQASASATLALNLNGTETKIGFGGIFIKDGVFYVRITELKSAIKSLMEEFHRQAADQNSKYATDFADTVDQIISDLAEQIDGEWWRIKVSEILDSIDDLDTITKNAYNTYYSCVYNVLTEELNQRSGYADLFREHEFLTISEHQGEVPSLKDQGKLYDVSVNNTEFNNFVEAVQDREFADKIGQCTNDLLNNLALRYPEHDRYDYNDDDYDDYDEYDDYYDYDDDFYDQHYDYDYGYDDYYHTDCYDGDYYDCISPYHQGYTLDLPDTFIVAIDGMFSHELKGIYFKESSYDSSIEGTFLFSYDNEGISAPSNARNLSELTDIIIESAEGITDAYQTYLTQEWGAYYGDDDYGDDDGDGGRHDGYDGLGGDYPYDNCSPNGTDLGSYLNCLSPVSS